ncbi:MAG: ABC-type oligopeptide transport system, periplasmic component [Actinomycetia bacterium]|nr:ABC-type oligopeptide transport system, periplasmic component [Actinomycetes bacterium]
MNRRHTWKWLVTAASLSVGLALIASACGSSNKAAPAGAGTTTTSTSTTASGGKTFANFRLAYDTGIDYLDPGLSYTVEGWGILWNVYLPLVGYTHANGPAGATIVPYLAKDLPKVSPDGKTYSLTLRSGLKYSDGTAIKASDFAATIERDFKIDSPGVGFFGNIVGADKFAKTKSGHIGGITTDDTTGDITIKLNTPQGDFTNILATEFAALLPANSPAKDQSTTPLPSSGPYMIKSYAPNKKAIVVRNPNFDAAALGGNVPAGNPDMMTVDIIGDDTVALQRVISGQDDYDFHQIPPDRLATTQQKYGDQIKIYTPANTYYFFMNNKVAPFDNLKVRQAVNYAINRDALVRIYGGLGQTTENVLPPTYPQYKKLALYPYDLAKAKKLIQDSGQAGATVTVWNHDRGSDPKATAYLTDVLNSIGLKAKEKVINSAVYWTTVGNQATKAQIGFADWFQDYPHPLDWFDVLLNGDRITQTHNNNYANFDNKAVNAKIATLKKEPTLTDAVNAQWASVDKMVDEQAPWAPFMNRQFTDFFNSDMDLSCYVNHVLYQFDYASICHK